jgi:hypothetical protein
MKIPRRLIVEMIVVLVIVLSCGGILWWPFLTADVKPWEQGREVPKTPPSEDRRVYNTHHFSFVAPPRWDWRVIPHEPDPTYAYPTMFLRPKKSIPARCGSIYVAKLDEMPAERGDLRKTSFQGEPAFFDVETRPGTFDDPPQFSYSLFFQRSGHWYRMGYVALRHQEELPPMVQRYLDTFRVEIPAQKAGNR